MSNNQLVIDGLDELRAALRRLPEELAAQASRIVMANANAAAFEIKTGYASHRISGDLQDKVQVEHVAMGRGGAGSRVTNSSKIANIFENGTMVRHTARGYNRGASPPGHVFIPAITRWRRRMYEELAALLVRNGLEVTGG